MKLNALLIKGLSDCKDLVDDRISGLTFSPDVFILRAKMAANKILEGCEEYDEEVELMNRIKEQDRNTMIKLDNEGDNEGDN